MSRRETCGSCRGETHLQGAWSCVNAQQPSLRVRTHGSETFFSLRCARAPCSTCLRRVCVWVFFSFHYHNPAASPVRLDGDVCHVGCFFPPSQAGSCLGGNVVVQLFRGIRGTEGRERRREGGGGGGASRENKCCHLTSNSQCEPPLWCVVELCCHQRQHNTDVWPCTGLLGAEGPMASVWSRAGANKPRLVWLMRRVLSSCPYKKAFVQILI